MSDSSKQSEQVCDLCGSADYRIYSEKGRHGVAIRTVICRGCGLVYTNPKPTEEENEDFYKRRYWGSYKNETKPDEAFFRRRLPKIQSMFGLARPHLHPGCKVLEIGSGVGALLSLIKEAAGEGSTVIGIEPHGGHSAFAREQKGLDVRTGLFHEFVDELEEGTFDLVVMNHVLEHTISPTETLRTIHRLLKPGGIYLVEVPNVQFPGSRISHYFHPAHHYAFSPNTLRHLAIKTGFDPRRVEELDGDLPHTRLKGTLVKEEPTADAAKPVDDADQRAAALDAYGKWYWMTLASIRKKFTHWKRQQMPADLVEDHPPGSD